MIVNMKGQAVATVVLHMSIMRQNVRNVFKKNYGKQQGKQLLESYDEVKNTLEKVLGTEEAETEEKLLEEAQEVHEFHFNVLEVQTLSSFLNFYIPTLEDFLKKSGTIQEADQGQLDTLVEVKGELDELKEIHKVV